MPSFAFLNQAVANVDRGGIRFTVLAGDASIACIVSQEALRDHFGAAGLDASSLIRAFHAKQTRIRSAARDKIVDGAFEPDGSVLLEAVDFWM